MQPCSVYSCMLPSLHNRMVVELHLLSRITLCISTRLMALHHIVLFTGKLPKAIRAIKC